MAVVGRARNPRSRSRRPAGIRGSLAHREGDMTDFGRLLRDNRNYRYTWSGQIVSEVGDHFNNIAVFSLALANTGSGLVVAGILIARAIFAMFAGPIAGV